MANDLATERQKMPITPPADEEVDEKRQLLPRAQSTESAPHGPTSPVLLLSKEAKMAALSNGIEYDLLGACDTDPLFAKETLTDSSEKRELNGQMRLVLQEGDDRSESSSSLLLASDEACDHHNNHHHHQHHPRESNVNSEPQNHDHCHSTVSEDKLARNKLIAVSGLCFLFIIAEIVGGFIANSLAIASDASHLACDLAGFLVSLFAIWVAKKPPTKKMSFGYHRAEVLGALVSVLIIWVITAVLVFLGIKRIIEHDYDIDGKIMLITACIGVAFNILMGVVLHSGIANCDIKSSFGHGHSHSHGGGHEHSHGGHGQHSNSIQHNHSHSSSSGSHGHSHSHSHSAHGGQSSRPARSASGRRLHLQSMPFDDSMNSSGDAPVSPDCSNHLMLSDSNENFRLPLLNDIPSDRSSYVSSHYHANGRSNEDDDDLIDVASNNAGGQRPKKKVNINVRAAMVHVIGDLVQSIGVMIAAIIINYRPDFKIADPICTFIFSFLVLLTTISILKDVISVIMEAVPRDVDLKGIKNDLKNISGIKSVHSLNVWALTLDRLAFTVHLGVDVPPGDWQNILTTATALLRQKHNMFQSTIQVELYEDAMRSCVHCHSE